MKRKATAVWQGSGKEGSGHVSTQSSVLNKNKYSFSSRFAEDPGTNPEELIAAAHAGCFTMKLSFVLGEAGYTPEELTTECTITLGDGAITESRLNVKGRVPNISADKFKECAESAKNTCPISKSLNPDIKMSVETTLL